MTSILFSPYRLADLALDNRVVVSPMCQYSADDGVANDWHLTHLGMLANSGAGLVIVEATHVERHGRITHGCLGLYSDHCEAALVRVIDHCRRIGTAKFGIQLAHSGRKGSAQRPWEGGGPLAPGDDPWPTIAPSAIPFGPGWHTPREANEEDLARVREAFAAAARRAVRIGFDAIELHMAHGYLLHGFMSPISNKRTDRYGGAFENRMSFPLDVMRAVRAVVPKGLPLGARITGSDWMEGGLSPADAVACAHAQGGGLRLCRRVLRRGRGRGAQPGDARLQRRHRGQRAPRGGNRDPHGGHDRDAEAGRNDGRRRQGRHGGARPRHAGRSALGLARRARARRRGQAAAAIRALGPETVAGR
jgi:NADPH2 dehydrogenase